MSQHRIVILGYADSVHVRRWAHGMCSRGFAMKVVSLGGSSIDGIDTTIIPRRSRIRYLMLASQARREAMAFSPNLVHAHSAAGYGWWALRSRFSPTLVSVWGTDIMSLPSNPIGRSIVRRAVSGANWVSATSAALKRVALDVAPEVKDRISVIPFGVVVPDRAEPLPPGPVRLCYAKGHAPVYGPDVLLHALVLAAQDLPDISLTMAGSGEMTSQLRQQVSESGLDNRVRFAGFVPHDDIYDFIRQHHIMVMPSRREGFGVAALEAMACARPVIASDVGGIPELVDHGRNGILVEPDNVDALARAIVELVSGPDLMSRMGQAGYEVVKERYDWERSLDMMAELYERLIYESR